jgi:hypothetical protein
MSRFVLALQGVVAALLIAFPAYAASALPTISAPNGTVVSQPSAIIVPASPSAPGGAGCTVGATGCTIPISGTVTAAGSAQGSTTAGETGPLVQGAVVSGDQSYVAGQTNPLTLTATGRLRVGLSSAGSVTGGTAGTNSDLIGCIATTVTSPVLTAGQQAGCQANANGSAFVQLSGVQTTGVDAISNAVVFAVGTSSGTQAAKLPVWGGYNFGVTQWGKQRDILGAAALGSVGTGTTAVEMTGSPFSNIATATTTTSKSGAGFLHSITVNTIVASATITVYDNTAGSGTKIATITLPSTITSDAPFTLRYDVAFATGLTIVTSGATDLTVSYR